VLAELGRLAPVEAVHGNMDVASLQATLPERRVVEAGEARIGVIHDSGPRLGREARLAAAFPGCGAVVYGHTHIAQVERFENVWILNPGSPTDRRAAPTRSMLVLEVEGPLVRPRLISLP
jgi:uncharacterized protein